MEPKKFPHYQAFTDEVSPLCYSMPWDDLLIPPVSSCDIGELGCQQDELVDELCESLLSDDLVLLAKKSSSYDQNEEIFQRDVILANHPLLPQLKGLLHETRSPNHVLIPSSVQEPMSGVEEADILLTKAITLMSKVPAVTSVYQGDSLVDIDRYSASILQETTDFCTKLLSGDDCEYPNHDSDITSSENDQGVANRTLLRKKRKMAHSPNIEWPAKKKRTQIDERSSTILKQWLFDHAHHPYPNDDEKDLLCLRTSLTIVQLNNWFVNARRRILQPYMRSKARLSC